MKSYLKFLSRNKLYTAIEAAGLIVSLAFVVIISCYVWQQFAVTREASDYKRTFIVNLGREELQAIPGEISVLTDRVPDIETGARLWDYGTGGRFKDNVIQGGVDVCHIDPEFFDIFKFDFIEGSPEILKDRDQVILGESFARKLAPDENIVGRTMVLRKDTVLIGGIVRIPENSQIKERDVYRAFPDKDEITTGGFAIPLSMALIRLREGADQEAARTLIDTVIRQEFSDWYRIRKPEYRVTMPIDELYFSPRNKGSILKKGNKNLVYTLIATGILLLFSALFNYINLSVALAGKRSKEMAIRSTLGETRRKVAWRFVSEALIFVATCMALALVLAKFLEPVFNRIVAGDINLDLSYSVPYLASYALLAALVGLISGLIPAWMSLRIDPVAVIKGEQRGQTKTVFSKIFIIIQNVLTVGLIALALVMELQFKHMVNMPLGADVSGLYYMSSGTIGDDELASKPYIDRIGKTNGYPGERNIMMSATLGENNTIDIGIINCDPEAFDMFGFEIVRDYHRPRMGTVWFSESAVRAYSIDEDEPVVPDMLKSHYMIEDHEIGGIVKDFAVEGPSKVTGAQIGILSIDDTQGQSCRVLKLNRLDSKVRAELKEIGRQESIRLTGDESRADNYGPINELIERGMSKERNFIKLIELFMLLAAIISLLGLVAMSAYYAGIQTKDIAVRKVFGGTVASETRKAVTEYLILVGVAILIGVPIAIFLAERYLQQFWYKIEGYGWVFVVAALIAILISFLAVLWQTLRAARTNPATELKKE